MTTTRQRYRVALNACIAANGARRAVPSGPEHFEARFEWRLIEDACRREYKRCERQMKKEMSA